MSRSAHLGTRYTCFSCGCRFFDLNRPEAICPDCGSPQDAGSKSKTSRRAASAEESEAPVQDSEANEEDSEVQGEDSESSEDDLELPANDIESSDEDFDAPAEGVEEMENELATEE